MLEVDSAFNGVALYRLAAVRASGCGYVPFYRVRPLVLKGECEHVPFHRCLSRQRVRIGIEPRLRTGCWLGFKARSKPMVSVRVTANGTIERRVDATSPWPKSLSHLKPGSAASVQLARKAAEDVELAQRLARFEAVRWKEKPGWAQGQGA